MFRSLVLTAAAAAAGMTTTAAWAAPAPRIGIASFAELKTPLPYPYDEKADAVAAIAAARSRANAGHKLLLIDLGGDWCPDCRILAGAMNLPELRAFVSAHYEVVTVDVGRFDKNLSIPGRYGLTRLQGVPTILIVDPRTDELLDRADIAALADARSMTPQALADWLARWTP